MKKLTVATRGSALALAQAKAVCALLQGQGIETEILTVETRGDRDKTQPLAGIGGDGLFVRGIEQALLDGRADIAVHSAKDLPFVLAEGLVIAGTPAAADPRDVLIRRADPGRGSGYGSDSEIDRGSSQDFDPGTDIRPGAVIGTGSVRRRMEFAMHHADVQFAENRGNIPTRVRKLAEGQFDAIVLAKAGIDRLLDARSGSNQMPDAQAGSDQMLDAQTGSDQMLDAQTGGAASGEEDLRALLAQTHCEVLSLDEMIPAPCQGILALECWEEDADVRAALRAITDQKTWERFCTERAIFCALKADCATAVAVHAEEQNGLLTIRARFGERRVCRSAARDERNALISSVIEELR